MSAFWANAIGVGIVMLIVVFVAIWAWAWLPYHKPMFDALARLPIDDGERERAREDAP